jgi:hypothetical protein
MVGAGQERQELMEGGDEWRGWRGDTQGLVEREG